MSNHFTGLNLGPPLGDQRLDLCDLYAFQSPTGPSRTVIILNANPTADALHPDAIYRGFQVSTEAVLRQPTTRSWTDTSRIWVRQTGSISPISAIGATRSSSGRR